jgi:hypothetical protein
VTRERYYDMVDQTLVLRRGALLHIIAAAQPPKDVVRDSLHSLALALGRVDNLQIVTAPARIDTLGVFRADMKVDSGGYVASLEMVSYKTVARVRHGAPAPVLTNGFGISAIALVDPRFDVQDVRLEDALLPSDVVRGPKHVGLYFEVYGVNAGETVEITLTGEPVNRSIMNRFLGALRLASAQPLRVEWRETAEQPTEHVLSRFFLVDATTLASGENKLTLTVRASGRTAGASRTIRADK